ncbi:hypothetical protein quinque_008860 [Culex quinquefasciatus]
MPYAFWTTCALYKIAVGHAKSFGQERRRQPVDGFLYIKSAFLHPLIMGVIRKFSGKMHLREGEFEKAHTDFFEAFKNYDESGSTNLVVSYQNNDIMEFESTLRNNRYNIMASSTRPDACNVLKYALDVIVNRRVNGTILVKRIEHVKSSRCSKDFLRRVKENCTT